MTRIGPLLQKCPDTWRYAIFGGLLSLPFTVASYAQTRSELSLSAVLVGGFLAGFLAMRRSGDSAGVGARAGIVGGLPVLWVLFDMFRSIHGLSAANPSWFSVVLVGLALTVTGLGFGLAALGGEIGSRVGSWVAGGQRSPAPQ